ncbi:MAG: riboflavin biosynthesis protein RibF [Verrucomicrobia bacterium 13_2_20CM_55_10]|nr:MAG: riboflavin biosynthesis protein RibF [Verrucomicrobia bacterium 13_2_20CM_55_10]OLB17251.1 MAG: riboflavin biosynthesis protein RibF [Verrucomicrobia bacterium 13_2_20CM_2_54_15_9cls]
METFRSISELSKLRGPLFLAIGVFDGVHLGHQAVISTSAQHARAANGTAVVVTFDPHPEKVLRPKTAPHLLTATPHKIALIRDLGMAHLLIITFDKQFAATEPEEFVHELVEHSKSLREICVGHEWSFGKNRRGNLKLLNQFGARFDFGVVGIPPVTVNGELVSSTTIRKAVETGDLAKAAQMLGREYTVLGTVVSGDNRGKKIGFPTANLSAHNEQFPPNGVYFAEAKLEGVIYPGVVNLGYRPTVDTRKSERILEIHLFDFDHDIYGKDLEVRFIRYLRPETKFESVEALVRQIGLDVKQARKLSLA